MTYWRSDRRWALFAVVVPVMLLTPCVELVGQRPVVGQIQRIRRVSSSESCTASDQRLARDAIQLKNGPASRTLSAAPPPEPLRLGDSIIVRRTADARLTIEDTTYGRGDIVLAPQLLCGILGADNTVLLKANSGVYHLDARADTLVFTVESGGAYFQWGDPRRRCHFQIIAAQLTGEVCGTQIVLAVDSSGTRAIIYVREGTVRFRDWPGVVVRAGQVFRLNAGTRPVLADAVQTARWSNQKSIDYHAADIWVDRPNWLIRGLRNPWTYGVAGVAGIAGVVAWNQWRDPAVKRYTKPVVVTIPL